MSAESKRSNTWKNNNLISGFVACMHLVHVFLSHRTVLMVNALSGLNPLGVFLFVSFVAV